MQHFVFICNSSIIFTVYKGLCQKNWSNKRLNLGVERVWERMADLNMSDDWIAKEVDGNKDMNELTQLIVTYHLDRRSKSWMP